jgi:hypothetical protein
MLCCAVVGREDAPPQGAVRRARGGRLDRIAASHSMRPAMVALIMPASSPGGVAAMTLAARNRQPGVPVVAAFHVPAAS